MYKSALGFSAVIEDTYWAISYLSNHSKTSIAPVFPFTNGRSTLALAVNITILYCLDRRLIASIAPGNGSP